MQDRQFEQYKAKALSQMAGAQVGYGVIKNTDYQAPVNDEEEVMSEEEEKEAELAPIDIENYTEEEEKVRESKQDRNKNQW